MKIVVVISLSLSWNICSDCYRYKVFCVNILRSGCALTIIESLVMIISCMIIKKFVTDIHYGDNNHITYKDNAIY